MSEYLNISQASIILGVSEKTLRIWDQTGRLEAAKTEGGHRRYDPVVLVNFMKTFKKDTQLEFIESGLLPDEELRKKEMEFWKSKGHIQTKEDEPLAALLTNLMHMLTVSSQPFQDSEFLINILVKYWYKDITKKIITWSPMTQPTGLIYYAKKLEDKVSIESESVSAVTRKMIPFFRHPSQESTTILDPKTFEPSSQLISNWYACVNTEELAESLAESLVRDMSKEIFEDISAIAKVIEMKPGEHIRNRLMVEHDIIPKAYVTNSIGIKILSKICEFEYDEKSLGLDAKKVADADGVSIYYSPDVNSEILISEQENLRSTYFFCPYMLFMSSPVVPNGNGLMARYAKKVVNTNRTHLAKIIL